MTRKTNTATKLVAVDRIDDQNLETSEDRPEETRTLEEIVADELLDSIDWKAVKQAILANVGRKFINWFVTGNRSAIALNEVEAQAIALESSESSESSEEQAAWKMMQLFWENAARSWRNCLMS